MNKISITNAYERTRKLKESGEHFTMVGIGPMSYNCLSATLSLAKEKDFPVMLIASRNQVDSDEFGGGYVCGFDQYRFKQAVKELAGKLDFDGLCYLCRDHGGPWQRDEERAGKLPVDKAMEIAKQSYIEDMKAGFDLLHIDPTKDPHISGVVDLNVVLERTVELISDIEKERKRLKLADIAYEVGTEETSGGLTSPEAFEDFAKMLIQKLKDKNLPLPLYIVGQTGTLTRLTQNVGQYNTEEAVKLTKIANRYGMGLKEHNGDYLSNGILLEHTAIGLDAMNVAPEFGLFETTAYCELGKIEGKFINGEKSGITEIITKYALKGERWRKWMMGEDRAAPVEKIAADKEKCALITSICGHYTLEIPEVKEAIKLLYANLKKVGIDGNSYVIERIKDSIDRYVLCFNNYGLTSKIMNV